VKCGKNVENKSLKSYPQIIYSKALLKSQYALNYTRANSLI